MQNDWVNLSEFEGVGVASARVPTSYGPTGSLVRANTSNTDNKTQAQIEEERALYEQGRNQRSQVVRPSATVSRIGLMESCSVVVIVVVVEDPSPTPPADPLTRLTP